MTEEKKELREKLSKELKEPKPEFNKKDYSDIVSYYDDISSGYDELHFDEQAEKFKILKEHMLIPDDSKVLDVGCGTFFSKSYFNWDMWGMEPSPKMVKLFIEKNHLQKDRIKVGFAEELVKNYGEEVFDAVICVSVAHHFKNPDVVFDEINKVCKPFAKIGITLLRNVKGFAHLEKEIRTSFEVLEVVSSSSKDVVFICLKK